ncbi:hypothetical protein HPP92_006227 [Vanilla planifolia]|uniref:Uncharacterized protein n=1 Tax=Vanilla planifolia TaxID=51239 RepID=A0A835RJY1_VANPL|nr:hypothetical protein HPP92_006227 [Vanilla planifolia]
MALSNGLPYAVAFLLLSTASAARLLLDDPQHKIDYRSNQAGSFAVRQYNIQNGHQYLFYRVLSTTHQTNPDGNSSDYFVNILAKSPDGTTAVYAAQVTISTDPDAGPILRSFGFLHQSAQPCT